VDTKKLDKIVKAVDDLKAGKPNALAKEPFVEVSEEQFEEHFNMVVREIGELATKTPEALELLKEFAWKGVIAIQLTKLKVDYKMPPTFKGKFMINVKAKAQILNRFLEITEFEKNRKERWEKPGYYFKINKQIIPTFNAEINPTPDCHDCKKKLGACEPQFHILESTEGPEKKTAFAYCRACSHKVESPLLYVLPDANKDDLRHLISVKINPKVEDAKQTYKQPTMAV